jgi:hypothetical protein
MEKHKGEKKMELRKISIALLALLLAAMAMVPLVNAEEKDQALLSDQAKVRELIKPIDADIHKIVDEKTLYSDKAGTRSFSVPVNEVIGKYDKNLDGIVDILDNRMNTHLDKANRTLLKEIIVTGDFKRISNDMELEKRGLKIEDAKVLTPKILGIVNSTDELNKLQVDSLLSAPHLTLYQTYVDIYGGYGIDNAGWPYNINGHNDLYKVLTWGSSYPYTYRLIYYDEDHPDPALDATYDYYRYLRTGTYEDSAQFTVWDANNLQYSLSWSGSYTFGYPAGNHGSITRNNHPWMYVSNIWNHDIGTENTNPSMSMRIMSVPYYPQ